MKKTISKEYRTALKEMDKAELKKMEVSSETIPMSEAYERIGLAGNTFFSICFARKNDKIENGKIVELAGSIRKMVCRRGVAKYTKGIIPEGQRRDEDKKNNVLTVFDVGVFQEMRKMYDLETAGEKSYRRINMSDVKSISVPPLKPIFEQESVKVRVKKNVKVRETV